MKKSLILIVIFSIVILGCKEANKQSEKEIIKKDIIKKDIDVKKIAKKEIPKDLLNQKLVGLVIKNTKETDVNKKYWVDFAASCMCDSPSIYINKKTNKLIIFNYCDNGTPPNNLEQSFEYVIYKFESDDKDLSVFSKDENDNDLVLIFSEISNSKIYNLKVIGKFPNDYVGNTLNKFFITKSNLKNLKKEDCGGFDG